MRYYLQHRLVMAALSVLMLSGCSWLFPPPAPPSPPQPLQERLFTDGLEWLRLTTGVVMDVNQLYVFSTGEKRVVPNDYYYGTEIFNHNGSVANQSADVANNRSILGLSRELVADDEPHYGMQTLFDYYSFTDKKFSASTGEVGIGAYVPYNTVAGMPVINPSPYGGLRDIVGPSLAKGVRYKKYRSGNFGRAGWMISTFVDSVVHKGFGFTYIRSKGKADISVNLGFSWGSGLSIINHQWGGTENDLAYDVASDEVGNPTIFLRAGTEFGITSATQTLVRMNTGYNIVRLDTNGLLTETFPVRLEAQGEITDAKIALGRGGVVYILAQDEVRQQAFLAKVTRAGTAWIRYFDPSVCIKGYYYSFRRMDLCVDSQNNVYITSGFTKTADMGNGVGLMGQEPLVYAFVAKYSPNNECLGALNMGGNAMGITIRLAPDERSLYVNGWADGTILGQQVPNRDNIRQGIMQPGAFLVKLKLK